MRTRNAFLVLVVAVAVAAAGCGGRPADPPPALTVADWKTMPSDRKYTPETLERLKQGDPTLETPEGWEAFSRTTLAAARKKDFPVRKR